jgi:FkbM family methyltransferase
VLNSRLRIDTLVGGPPFTVLDVGARGGVHPRWTRFLQNYAAVLFEPEPEEYARLQGVLPENYMLLNTALSEAPGERTLYVTRSGGASSVYQPNMTLLRRFPHSDRYEVEKQTSLEADSLDNVLRKESVPSVDFIKIDTQGHELAILSGARSVLNTVLGLELEVEFLELYCGQPLFADVDAYARRHGFELFDLRRSYWSPVSGKTFGKGELVFGDALYLRSPEAVCSMPNADGDLVLKAAIAYAVYGYFGFAQSVLELGASLGLVSIGALQLATQRLSRFRRFHMFSNSSLLHELIRLKEFLSRIRHGTTWYSADPYVGNLFFWF